MREALLCPQCQEPVPADAPQGLCPVCMLQLALRGASADIAGSQTIAPRQLADSPSGPVMATEPPMTIAVTCACGKRLKVRAGSARQTGEMSGVRRSHRGQPRADGAMFARCRDVIHNPQKGTGWWREHRTVCLPDYQGIGMGNALSEFVASVMVTTGKEYRSTTSHPSMMRHRSRAPLWVTIRAPELADPPSGEYRSAATISWDRPTAGFRNVGPANHEAAEKFGILVRPRP